ncbi:MAG: DUF4012 domain-containing protein [Mycobacteriales bacterium]
MLPRRRLLQVCLLLLVVAGLWTGVRLLAARHQLQQARSTLQVARTALLDRRFDAARTALEAASRSTRRARALTGDPVTAAWGQLPVLGNNVAVARGLARAADDASRRVLAPALVAVEGLDPRRLRRPDGSIDLALLHHLTPPLERAAAAASDVRTQAHRLPGSLLLGSVGTARRQLLQQVDALATDLTDTAEAVRLAPAFLGEGRARHWFVLVQQTGESRGTGGIPGGFAVLEARDGRLRVTSQGSDAQLRNEPVAAPASVSRDVVNRYAQDGVLDLWQNVTLPPDVPSVAHLVEARWRAQGGGPLDGVVMLDGVALSDLLRGGPAIDLGGGRVVQPDALEDYLALGQYRDVADPLRRKDKLVAVARAVLTRVSSGGGDSTALLKGMVRAVSSGHLHLASDDPALEPVLARTGLDGALPHGPAPLAYAVVDNASGDKLEYFLDRSVTYEGGGCDGARRRTTVTVRLRNRAPAVGALPAYVTLRLVDPQVHNSATGRVLLEVYGTRGARLVSATLDGKAVSTYPGRTQTPLEAGTLLGLPVWRVTTDTPPGRDVTFVLHLDEPTAKGAPRVPEQPLGSRPFARRVTLPRC